MSWKRSTLPATFTTAEITEPYTKDGISRVVNKGSIN